MSTAREQWLRAIGKPSCDFTPGPMTLITRYDFPDFDAELYSQPNGPGTAQRLMMVFPKRIAAPCPAVAVPFYFPEAMLGFEPDTGELLPMYAGIEMMLHLVRRGYVCACADCYHLTYYESTRERGEFARWREAAAALRQDHPGWSGVGKLIADTQLVIDALCADERVDAESIGIAGHSLGGKMAFYTGCVDERVKVILSSDFGMGWDQTNWRDKWYWGSQVDELIADGMDHSGLLGASGGKPMALLAGEADDDSSFEMMRRAPGYTPGDGKFLFINHATGHRPPAWALREGYDFLDRWLK